MRLLTVDNSDAFHFAEYEQDDVPNYAILSHTWGADGDEVTFKDLENGTGTSKPGYNKLRFCSKQATKDNLRHFWIDSCCIDKSSSAELSEAINSMFRWYRNASKCYVYLSDVSTFTEHSWQSDFKTSRWFTRGWTLQELLASNPIEFFSSEGLYLGGGNLLERQIHEITGVPLAALRGAPLSGFKVDEKFSWAKNRKTKRPEDQAYALCGIFNVSMSALYGEGRDRAIERLRREVELSQRHGSMVTRSFPMVENGRSTEISSSRTDREDRNDNAAGGQGSALAQEHSHGGSERRIGQSRSTAQVASGLSNRPEATARGSQHQRLVIGLDYGTSFTGLAFAYTDSSEVDMSKIEIIQYWTSRIANVAKVPSLISYSKPKSGEAQWGSDICSNSITMVNTKLELDQGPLLDELDMTLSVLAGTGNLEFEHLRRVGSSPDYTSKSPTEIITDYLSHICRCMRRSINIETLTSIMVPVDIVVTVPVAWSDEASDAILRAVRGAGFNQTTIPTLKDTILVSEQEAAAHFLVRDLQASDTEFLKVGDCFVLCDAGDGTVDVVSFQVKQTHPYVELSTATEPKSGRCGSAFVNVEFKKWLRNAIGIDAYSKLDPANPRFSLSVRATESGPMRQVIRAFEAQNRRFSNESHNIKLQLPPPLHYFNIKNRVHDGEITIRRREMKQIVDTCVNEVIEMIIDQIQEIGDKKGRRTKHVLLIGGFGASPYLQEELSQSLKIRNIRLHRPHSSRGYTAVAQGAVIYGIEKSKHSDVCITSSLTRSYGIVIDGRFYWLAKKGDLVLSNKVRIFRSMSFWIPRTQLANYRLPIYAYRFEDDDLPEVFQNAQHDVECIGVIKCDFSRVLDNLLRERYPMETFPDTGRLNSGIGPLSCQMTFSQTTLEAGVLLINNRVGSLEVSIEVDPPSKDESSVP